MTDFITNNFYTWYNTKTKKKKEFKYIEGQWTNSDGVVYDFITLTNLGWVLLSQ